VIFPVLSVPCPLSLPTSSLPTFPAKSLGHAHSSNACLINGSDPDAAGVCVALKETPCPLWVFSLPTLSSTIPYFDCFPAHLSSSLSWFYAAYTWTVIHTKEVNLCLNCSEQKSQTIFLKQFVSHPPGLIIFCSWTHFNQSGNFGLVNPFQSIRQLWVCEPTSINQATLGSWTHVNQSGNFGLVNPFQSTRQFLAFVFSSFISFILFITVLFIGCFIHLCI